MGGRSSSWTCMQFRHAQDRLEDVPSDLMEEVTLALCNAKPCCLDPFWARPAQEKILAVASPLQRSAQYFRLLKQFYKHYRPASLNEEKRHSLQRLVWGV